MKKMLLIMLILALSECIHAQKDKSVLSDSTTNIIRSLSYFWKLDSLANNGFRLFAHDRLVKSKIDTVSIKYLIDNLGNPNQIINTNKGVIYNYYYYDTRKLPKEFGGFEIGYLSFMFHPTRKVLISISDEVMP
jgi:hypothetical protein